MPKITFHSTNLKTLAPALHADISKTIPLQGHCTIDTRKLDHDLAEQLVELLPLLSKMTAPGSMEEHEAFDRARLDIAIRQQAEEAQHQAVIDGGNAQLAAYHKVGLADTKRNADIIRDAITRRDGGIFCSTSVRNAVEAERSNLTWVKVEAPAPVAAPAAPAIRLLENGEPELPLHSTEATMRRASVTQLRDLSNRRREGQSRPGWSSARL